MGTILIFCAHSDDEAIGMGGTIAKYVSEGKKVVKIVFSHGEKSIPHLQEAVVKKARFKETDKASAFIGIASNKNLGLRDTRLRSDVQEAFVARRLREIIMLSRPEKIYLPSALDPHQDHQAVNRNVFRETHPRVYVDISSYIKIKMIYIKMFKSQWVYMFSLYFPTLFRSFYYGRENSCQYAERFYKLR